MRAGRARDLEKTRARGRVHQKTSEKSYRLARRIVDYPKNFMKNLGKRYQYLTSEESAPRQH